MFIFNKKKIIKILKWFPNGRLYLTGLSSGELVVLNGFNFKKEVGYRIIKNDEALRSIGFA